MSSSADVQQEIQPDEDSMSVATLHISKEVEALLQ